MREFIQVDRDTFFAAINPLNVHPVPRPVPSKHPDAGSDWVLVESREIIGRSVAVGDSPNWKPRTNWFLWKGLLVQ